jgi:hypothetical protein
LPHQLTTNALSSLIGSYGHHRDIAIGDLITQRSGEAHHTRAINRNNGAIGILQHLPEPVGITHTMLPANFREELANLLIIIGNYWSKFHLLFQAASNLMLELSRREMIDRLSSGYLLYISETRFDGLRLPENCHYYFEKRPGLINPFNPSGKIRKWPGDNSYRIAQPERLRQSGFFWRHHAQNLSEYIFCHSSQPSSSSL